jgi:hypothetical protein
MIPGCVIMFYDSPGGKQFGQVTKMEHCEIEFKIIHKTEFAVVRNWLKAHLAGKLIVVLPALNGCDLKKTMIIPIAEVAKKPNFIYRSIAFMKGCKYCRNKTGKWILKTRVTGSLFVDGWFIPDPGEAIKKPMFFENYNRISQYEWQMAKKIVHFFI